MDDTIVAQTIMARVSTSNTMVSVRSQRTATVVTTHDSIMPQTSRHAALRVPSSKSTAHSHSSKRRGIEGRASHACALDSPAHLASEHCITAFDLANSVAERHVAVQGDVVESEIPDGCVYHAVGAEGEDGANDGAGDAVVPVVELVDGEGTRNEGSAENGCVDSDQLPHRGVVVREDLELGVEVEVKEDETRKSSRGVTRRE